MPQSMGFNGLCMNSVGVQFHDSFHKDNNCQQDITDLSVAAQSYLNPETYVKKGWGMAKGTKSSTMEPLVIKVGSVWTIKSSDDTISKTYPAPAPAPDPTPPPSVRRLQFATDSAT